MRKNVFQYSSIKRILFTIAVGLCLIGATTAAKADITAYYESNANSGTFGTLDLTTGVATPINTTNGLSGIVGLGVYNGNLYAAMNVNNIGQLFSIDTATGVALQL